MVFEYYQISAPSFCGCKIIRIRIRIRSSYLIYENYPDPYQKTIHFELNGYRANNPDPFTPQQGEQMGNDKNRFDNAINQEELLQIVQSYFKRTAAIMTVQ